MLRELTSRLSEVRSCGRSRINAFYFLTAGSAALATCWPDLTIATRVVAWATAWSIVMIHEMGHILVALGTGRKIRRSVALPGWGCTKIKGPNAHDAGWIGTSLAGPLMSTLFAGAALLGLSSANPERLGNFGTSWIELILAVSLLDSAINLLPCWKFDGGHVYRTLQEFRLRKVRAKVIRPWRAHPGKKPELSTCSLPRPDHPSGKLERELALVGGRKERREPMLMEIMTGVAS